MENEYDCIVPAAGASVRMGEWKLLLDIEGKSVVERSVANALSFCRRVVLVVGYRGEELARRFAGRTAVTVMKNPHYEQGLASSIRTGARAVRSQRFFVALADMPFIDEGIYRLLAGFGAPSASTSVVRPVYNDPESGAAIPGHPVLFPEAARHEILARKHVNGMNEILRLFTGIEVPTRRREVVLDLDTPADYDGLKTMPRLDLG